MFKKYLCCAVRNVLWQIVYCLIYTGIVACIVASILILFGNITSSVFLDGLKETDFPKDVIQNYINYSAEISFLVAIVVSTFLCLYPVYKKSLQKVFFKPYKKFTLNPTIKSISHGIVIQYFALSILFNLPVIVYGCNHIIPYLNIEHFQDMPPGSPFVHYLNALWSSFISPFIATTIIIKKYSKFS